MKIDIGGGTRPLPDYVNLDPEHGDDTPVTTPTYGLAPFGWKRRAQDGWWPAADDSVDAVNASHVMEHIPAGADRIFVMNEAWRVLRSGGEFTIVVPLFPSWESLADPTHVSFWVPESFDYFVPHAVRFAQADYGIKLWELVSSDFHGAIGTWTGRKP